MSIFRLNIERLQSIAQIHSYYITNMKSELKFSSSNLSEDELETIIQEITMAINNNDDLFSEEDEEERIFSDDENIHLEEEDTNDLLITKVMNLDNFEEKNDEEEEENSSIEIQSQSTNHEDSNIDFEAILNEELE